MSAPTIRAARATVGLVLAGGGARGTIDLRALAVLLPELHPRGHDVEVLVGTSVGALDVAWPAPTLTSTWRRARG